MRRLLGAVALTTTLAAAGCGGEPPVDGGRQAAPGTAAFAVRAIETPAGPRSFAPRLLTVSDGIGMTWLERDGAVHRVRFARRAADAWSEPVTLVEGDDLFANWADFPAVVEGGDGALYAHWLAKTGEETYAYSIDLARSTDGGVTWRRLGRLNDDDTPTEHGFVSWVAAADGARAVWLDGREMAAGGPMTLFTAKVDAAGAGPAEVLDERVCECCNTALARAGAGRLVVAYRDRSEGEVRDIATVLGATGDWSEPALPHADGWKIDGCPVNGPALAAAGSRVTLAWFTAAEGAATVQAALSSDGGASFAPPWTLDAEAPLGRVDVAFADAAAWVAWMAPDGDGAEVRLARITDDGPAAHRVVARTGAARASGFPRLLALEDRLFVAWTDVAADTPRQVRLTEVALQPVE